MHGTLKEKFPIEYGNALVHTMKVIKYSIAGENVGSPDVVTYFPRLIDKGNYTGGNMVTKVMK